MTPADARANMKTHKVRMFDSSSLITTVAAEEWDRVQVVCTQPFNRSIQYGLSFISFITDDPGEKRTLHFTMCLSTKRMAASTLFLFISVTKQRKN